MKSLHLEFTALALAFGMSTSYAAGMPAGTVYSANEGDHSISVIDVRSGTVRTVNVAITPHNVQIAPDGKTLLAVGMPVAADAMHDMSEAGAMKPQMVHEAHDEATEGNLLVMDAIEPDKVLARLPAGRHPAHVVTDRFGSRAYITSSADNRVTVVDLRQRRVVGNIPTGAFPHGLRPSPDGRELYVANVEDDSVSVIDAKALKQVARIPVGRAPVQVAFTPDGTKAYVSLRDANQVAVIDTRTRHVVGRIPVGRNPIQLYATADGRTVYVANQGSDKLPDNRVSVIDVDSGRVIDTVTAGAGAHGVVASGNGSAIFVTNTRDSTVTAIDTDTRHVAATWHTGSNPNGITYRVAP